MPGMFGGLGKVQMNVGGNFFHDGKFLNFIQKVRCEKARKGYDAFKVEQKVCVVLEANPRADQTPLRVGMQVCHMTTSNKDSYLGNVKTILGELLSCKNPAVTPEMIEEEEWEGIADEAVGANQIVSGQFVMASAHTITTRDNKLFTVIKYPFGVAPAVAREFMLKHNVDEKVLFPGGELQKMIDAESAAAAAAPTA